jgi:hypothetical protein
MPWYGDFLFRYFLEKHLGIFVLWILLEDRIQGLYRQSLSPWQIVLTFGY